MTKFAEVEMPITTPGDKAALALLRELDRRAQETARNGGAAASASISSVQKHSATAARAIAGNVAMIAAAGEATAGSLKGILSQGANIAFMFGSTGAIGGAIALTGLAIYNLFNRTRAEIEATSRKALEELEKIARAGDLAGASQRAQFLFSGDPFAAAFGKHEGESDDAFEKRRMGLLGIRAAIQAQESKRAGITGTDANSQAQRTFAYNEIFRLKTLEHQLAEEYARTIPVVNQLAAAESARSENALNRLREVSDKERGGQLHELLSGFAPAPGLMGKPMMAANELDLSDAMLKGIQERLKKVPPIPTQELTPDLQRILNFEHLADDIGNSFGMTLADAISAGITAGFEGGGLAGGFKAATGAILSAMGSMLKRVGVAALGGLQFIAAIKEAIKSFAPELGIPAAIALIALGSVLQSSGNALANSGGGGQVSASGATYGAGAGPTIIDRGIVNPLRGIAANPASLMSRPQLVFAPTIIGKHDAQAQRELVDMVELGLKRSGRSLDG